MFVEDESPGAEQCASEGVVCDTVCPPDKINCVCGMSLSQKYRGFYQGHTKGRENQGQGQQ